LNALLLKFSLPICAYIEAHQRTDGASLSILALVLFPASYLA